MAIDLSKPAVSYVPCIEVSWAGGTKRYCRAESDLTIAGDLYEAMEDMDFELDFRGGGIEDKPQFVIVDIDQDPFNKMLLYPFGPVTVKILDADLGDLAAEPSILYIGEVAITKARFSGNERLMRLELWGRKAELVGVSLGMKCTGSCNWAYGHSPCQDVPFTTTAEVTSVDGTIIELDSLALDNVLGDEGRYTRGFVDFEGLRILIRKHHVGEARFTLASAPPQASSFTWLGKTINITQGCTKSVAACTARGQLENFAGLGLVMPEYNPVLEDKPL